MAYALRASLNEELYSNWYISFSTVPNSTASSWAGHSDKMEGCRAATAGVTPQWVITVNKACPDCNDDVLTFKDGSPFATTTALTYTIGSEATVLLQPLSEIQSQANIRLRMLFDCSYFTISSSLNPLVASIVSTNWINPEFNVSIETSDIAVAGSYQLTITIGYSQGTATAASATFDLEIIPPVWTTVEPDDYGFCPHEMPTAHIDFCAVANANGITCPPTADNVICITSSKFANAPPDRNK